MVAITTIPRSTLDHARHREIDAVLKDLRLSSRRLTSILDSFDDELRTLERLYYKCKNQHRSTLFFKRIPELRRYGRRLSELDIVECVDLLRASFVGLENTNDHKALRSSWSLVPNKPYVCLLIERLDVCSTLTSKIRERLEKAHRHFAFAMQTGAFVQQVILFVAISCRMFVLSSRLEEALQLSISACNRLLSIVRSTDRPAPISQQANLEHNASPVEHDILLVDSGPLVSGCELVDTSTSSAEEQGAKVEAISEMRDTSLPSHSTNAADHTATQLSKEVATKVAQKPRPKKAKKKIDEIDAIFGF